MIIAKTLVAMLRGIMLSFLIFIFSQPNIELDRMDWILVFVLWFGVFYQISE